MAIFNTSLAPNQNVNVIGVTQPDIINFLLTNANTEYTINLPSGTQRFQIKSRGKHLLKLSYNPTESGSLYVSVWPGDSYQEFGIDSSSAISLYVQSTGANEVVEIISWT